MTNLQMRVITALIYFPLLLLSVFQINIFILFMFALLCGALHEYNRFLVWPSNRDQLIKHIYWILLGTLPFLSVMFEQSFLLGFGLMAVFYQVYFVRGMFLKRSFSDLLQESSQRLFGYLFLSGLFCVLVLLRQQSGGEALIWFLLFVVGAADTGAYFVGRKWGRTPFFEWISPKKTWEGGIGGLVAALLVSVLFYGVLYWNDLFVPPPLWLILIMGLAVAVGGIFGDLMVSMIKRNYKVKDSGGLFFGHGGVLDRFDGVLFAGLPLLVIVLVWKAFV